MAVSLVKGGNVSLMQRSPEHECCSGWPGLGCTRY